MRMRGEKNEVRSLSTERRKKRSTHAQLTVISRLRRESV